MYVIQSSIFYLAFYTLNFPFLIANDPLRVLDDQIAYRIEFKQANDLDNSIQLDDALKITSDDNEQYQCILPEFVENSRKKLLSYSGPTPADLLQTLYDENICSYRIESYWYYELCHGRFLLQYHENRENKIRTEYYLGNFAKLQADAEMKTFDQLNPPVVKIGDNDVPYYPVTYGHGTTCDLTKKPRVTVVMYVCDEDSKNSQIYSLNELSSCVYEVIVMTNRLCAHPSFHKLPPEEFAINCYTTKDRANAKPKSLSILEKEASSQFFQEFSLFKSASKAPSKKNVFAQLFRIDTAEGGGVESGFEQLNAIIEAIKSSAKVNKKRKPGHFSQNEEHSMDMASLIDSFWSGKICLHGGVGWWQYELCYGRMVSQFHNEEGEKQSNIILGVFHDEDNREWFEQHSEKVIEKGLDGRILQVSNIYTRGDICEETQAHRKCEVRIRCREDMAGETILLQNTEPNICSYILTVESALFCDGLQKIDFTTGTLVGGMPPLQEYEKSHEPQTFSSIPERKNNEVSKAKLSVSKNFEKIDEVQKEYVEDDEQKNKKETTTQMPSSLGSPFQIDVLQQDQLLELVNIIQNEDIVLRKIVIEKPSDTTNQPETAEAKLTTTEHSQQDISDEDELENENDKKSNLKRP